MPASCLLTPSSGGWYAANMATTPDRLPAGPLTYEDYAELPDDGNRYEILDGEIFVTPPPPLRHQRVLANLQFELTRHVREHGLGEILPAPVDLILALATQSDPDSRTTIAQPDLLFLGKSRGTIVTERAIESAPDLVVEILSPSTTRKDRTTKAGLYARFGVPHYWIVDPDARTLELYELEGESYRLVSKDGGEAIVRPALFPGLELRLGEIWA